ncbi:MAG: hypothetical protein NC191_06980 [Muribaculaceae bacterium]|nr:hypothetical protein [Muribaculaceae bacterium]
MQNDIFTTADNPAAEVGEAIEAYKNLPKKRIHNEIPTYTKTYENYQDAEGNIFDDVNTWGRMSQVYSMLGNNHFHILFSVNDIQDFGIVRSRTKRYFAEKYKYKDLMNPKSRWQTYTGQDFEEKQAEIIGSELLGIEERLFLHETLLEYLEMGYRIEQLNGWIEQLLNLCLQGFSARIIVLALILWRQKNEI